MKNETMFEPDQSVVLISMRGVREKIQEIYKDVVAWRKPDIVGMSDELFESHYQIKVGSVGRVRETTKTSILVQFDRGGYHWVPQGNVELEAKIPGAVR